MNYLTNFLLAARKTSVHLVIGAAVAGMISLPAMAATRVTVKSLSSVVDYSEMSAPASVVNEHHITISSEITATLKALPVKVGDHVKAGDPLADLDCRDYSLYREQALQNSRALSSQAGLASQQLKRAKALQKSGSVSVDVLNQRQAEVSAFYAQLKASKADSALADLNVERCTVSAPFDGVVTAVMTAPGALLVPGAAVVKLLDSTKGEVKAQLQPEQLFMLENSQFISFNSGGQKWTTQVRAVLPFIESAGRTQEVRLSFKDADSSALSGMIGELNWQSAQPLIPAMYTVTRNGEIGVMLAEGETARFVPIPNAKPGQPVATRLPPSAKLIVNGQYVLNNGDEIQVETQGQ
jgi:RND family efflux transporter MFP subunit